MRLTRNKMRQEYRKRKIGFLMIFAIVLPSLSIYLGYIATKFYIMPNLQSKEISQPPEGGPSLQSVKKDEEKGEAIPTGQISQEAFANTFELQGLDLYCVQVGKFTAIENAQTLLKELKNKGMEGYIHEQDGYKVIAAALLDREGADQAIQSIRIHYPDAYVARMNIPVRAVKYTKEDVKYVLVLQQQNKRLIHVFDKLSTSIKEFKGSKEQINPLIKENVLELKSIKEEINKITPSKSMEKITAGFLKTIDATLSTLEEMQQDGQAVQLQNSLNRGLYEYFVFATSNTY
ncbi:SPOR domain-containing protein [Thermotalea metallivorans]|uniref:SPOR domain-containing protein n=1 Tax=Thermotalea metallivorans TaxID=520762 RepID=A0A140L957_9FIRM|nr:SPOR domain-containing protein [Thermotalea metallivorans]KXG77082.1 hypothetical protein AN619_06100 [Thermotalea metallivorans]